MNRKKIILKNVRVHNLKGVDLTLDPSQLIVFTGVSGSGKSSLAFDTIYMEGQRRYIESLSSYARRHLGDFPKPEADHIEGISPTIAIEQKTTGKNPRSTVGTMTGIYDFLRVLFARAATPYCPVSLEPVSAQSAKQILEEILCMPKGTKIILLAPYASGKKGEFKEEFIDLTKQGFMRIRLDGKIVDLTEDLSLDGTVAHDIDLVIDRLQITEESQNRLTESVHAALEKGKGLLKVFFPDREEEKLFSEHAYSVKSGLSYGPLEPSDFSFNHPSGMCSSCNGLGVAQEFDLSKIISPDLSIAEDCCSVGSSFQTIRYGNIYTNLARLYKFNIDTPWKNLSEKAKRVFLYGTGEKWTKMRFVHPEKLTSWTEFISWKGVLHEAKERYIAAQSELYKKKMEENFHQAICGECKGSRLKPYPSAAKLQNKTIFEITEMPIKEALFFFENLKFSKEKGKIAEELIKEIKEQLTFLNKVGLQYLSLSRTSPTLSGGEGQRVRLASQIGSGLVGATYILDEPSIGLHPRDNHKLLQMLLHLKDKGNTVIVVEHDEETILLADTVVDVGPLAGTRGGNIICTGSVQDLLASKESLTGGYLSGRLPMPLPKKRRKKTKEVIEIKGATHHNLKNTSATFPLGLLIAVTGVSGSGKSSLIIDTLYPALSNLLQGSELTIGKHESIKGMQHLDKIIAIDQSPIGRTPRSNPATYIKLFDEIRDLFTLLPESQMQGFTAGRFSFNVKEGCCPFCVGMGMTKIDMDFMEDEWTSCEHCQGRRFDETTLSVRFKDKTIHDVLEMSVSEAFDFFAAQPKIKTKLDLLMKVGLDYIKLGQPSPTLSGGEAQRIKLAKELSRPSTGKTFYILDEPTTGLHFHDIKNLIAILHSLVDKGNTVLVIEHNMDLVRTADWIVDLGPEAGNEGGEVIGEGTPEEIAKQTTPTGIALKAALSPKKIPKSHPIKSAEPSAFLTVKGAFQNNLKYVDASIPLGKITVCTGPSGSGKSSFAFETIYAEGQRRYIESMSHYARQFVKQMPKPKIEQIEGLSASIAIEQKNHAGNPRSTIGTMTEIYDYLRLIYCHLGTPFCPETGEEIRSISKEYVVQKAMELPPKSKLIVLTAAPFPKNEAFEEFKERMIKQGFLRVRLNGTYYELEEDIPFEKKKKNELLLVIDRLILNEDSALRLSSAIEQATAFSDGSVILEMDGKDKYYNLAFTVESTGKSYAPITPHTFSFNTKQGMCQDCQGLGIQYGADLSRYTELLELSAYDLIFLLCKELASSSFIKRCASLLKGIDLDEPLKDLSKEQLLYFFQGDTHISSPFTWKGLNQLLIQYTKSSFGNIKWILSQLLEESPCVSCEGTRLSPIARNVKIKGVSIAALCNKSIEEATTFIEAIKPENDKEEFLEETLKQTLNRLSFLNSLGLGYLSLDRSAPTLSGGETQRIRLSRQLGSGLTGCLYVLDEPTIGLHPYDNHLLNQALQNLKDLGNTLLLVEHDPLTLQIADYILDFGPGAGKLGGQITARGSLESILKNTDSLTGNYLSGRKKIELPSTRKTPSHFIEMTDVSLHNINHLTTSIPIGLFTCLTGVSGSGKSTLLMDILKPVAEKTIVRRGKKAPVITSSIQGLDAFDKLIVLEQNPIGTTIRADVSTYTDLLTPLRHLYASLPEAKARGLLAKHFSFNHKKGMCKACWGIGTRSVSLQFLPSVKVECESCKGYRLNPLSLQVTFKEKHLGEILKMSVAQAREFFDAIPKVFKVLDALASVGLDYLSLGQEIASLSGGESQRLRLSRELAKRSTGKTLYLLDEPSVGLHASDIAKLTPILHSLTNKGNTVILIEHNLDLIANCDYVIDIGPGAGAKGGKVLFAGTPEELALCPHSKTAPFLKEFLRN